MFGSDYQDQGLICCQPDGQPIEPNNLSADFAAFHRRLMLNTRYHDLRHGHPTQALQSGVPVKTVQARLGHSTAAFTLDV
jgi:integrase